MKRLKLNLVRRLALLILVSTSPLATGAGHAEYDLTARVNIVGSSGKPTNDILGYGVTLQRKLDNGWYLGLNLDYSPRFDFERPSEIVDIKSDLEIDAVGSMLMITLVGERRYALESRGWTGFWSVGGGFAEIDMDDADGAIRGGGTYAIETDIDTELILIASAGWMQQLGRHWSARYTFSAESHIGGWDLRDRVSGRTGEIDDYAVYGVRIGMNYRY